MTRVALTILSRIAFANFDTLYIFLTAHNKDILSKYIATTRRNISYVITTTKSMYYSLGI